MLRGIRLVIVAVVVVFGAVFFLGARLMKPALYVPTASAAGPPTLDAALTALEALYVRFAVGPDGLDYAAWRADAVATRTLDDALAALAAPFPSDLSTTARLRALLHAQQALQVRVVLETSVADVTDLPAPLSMVEGDGILRRRALRVDGRVESVFGLVGERIALATTNPRVVFAAGGVAPAFGPIARRIPADANGFDRYLDERAAAFFATPEEFRIDGGSKEIRVASRLFRWRGLFVREPIGPGQANPETAFREALVKAAPAEFAERLGDRSFKIAPAAEAWRVR